MKIDIGQIDLVLLQKQISAVNNSNLSVDDKEGIHNLLGKIRDEVENMEYFSITSVSKNDILHSFEGTDKIKEVTKRLKTITDHDMERLASKMANDYTEQLYWSLLRIIFEDNFL